MLQEVFNGLFCFELDKMVKKCFLTGQEDFLTK